MLFVNDIIDNINADLGNIFTLNQMKLFLILYADDQVVYLPLNVFTASKGSNHYILFAITAAGVVPCGGRKKSPRT